MDLLNLRDGGVPDLVPIQGGHSGETFLAVSAGERTVVRIYARRSARRGATAVEVDAAVLRLVRGLLPVPEVLEVRRADGSAGMPALLVTSWLGGTRLDEVLPGADDALAAATGANVGRVLSRLAQMPMLRAGAFVDGDLRLGPLPEGADDLHTWAEHHAATGPLSEWRPDDRAALLQRTDHAQDLLGPTHRTCLVHSDFNAKNLLVDPATGEVTGVLDWEYAHAGSAVTDLGNMLRFERRPVFADAVLGVYADEVPDAGPDLLDRARAADLYALIDLAARRAENPVTERAHDLLLSIARTGNLHATP